MNQVLPKKKKKNLRNNKSFLEFHALFLSFLYQDFILLHDLDDLEFLFYNLTIVKIFPSESEWDAEKLIEKTRLDGNIWQQLRRESAV